MKNILFIGHFYPKGIIENIVSHTYGKVTFANHNFERSLIAGFKAQKDIKLRLISVPLVFSYPHNNKNRFIKEIKYKEDGIPVNSIGFCNVSGFNTLSRIKSLKNAIIKEVNTFDAKDVTVIVNTPTLEASAALFYVKKNIPKNIKTILIVPDVPECMLEMGGKTNLKSFILSLINKKNLTLSRKYDKYVFLTEAMNDYYHASKNDYIVMEGVIDNENMQPTKQPPISISKKEIILYTGTLFRIFGVMDLIDAFEALDSPNVELWICGSGECEDEIKRKAGTNINIKFFGLVETERSRELQRTATILANPRSANGSYTKYSFPSKTIEYLLAGKSVIMNRLPGVPDEYNQFIYYPANESTEAWVKKLQEIIDEVPSKRAERGKQAQDFILNNKTAIKQCARIINL